MAAQETPLVRRKVRRFIENHDRLAERAIPEKSVLANLNCREQLVISGETEKIGQACELAKARSAILSVGKVKSAQLFTCVETQINGSLRE